MVKNIEKAYPDVKSVVTEIERTGVGIHSSSQERSIGEHKQPTPNNTLDLFPLIDINNRPVDNKNTEYGMLITKLKDLGTNWAAREKTLENALSIYRREICKLRIQTEAALRECSKLNIKQLRNIGEVMSIKLPENLVEKGAMWSWIMNHLNSCWNGRLLRRWKQVEHETCYPSETSSTPAILKQSFMSSANNLCMSAACSWYINGKNGDSFSTKSEQELRSPVSERKIGKWVIESKVLAEDILNDGYSHAYSEATRSPLKSDISFPPEPPFKSDPNRKSFGNTFKS